MIEQQMIEMARWLLAGGAGAALAGLLSLWGGRP